MTNDKTRKYYGIVGGPDVETQKTKQHDYLTESTNLC